MRQAWESTPRGCGAGPLRPWRSEGGVRHRHGGTCCSDHTVGSGAIAGSMVPRCSGPSRPAPPEAIGAEISSTTMAKPGPDNNRPPRSAHQRVDARKPSPQQRAPAVPIENLLEALPDATERKEAQMRLHRLAVLEDRERIAKELHDGVIQALFAVGMNLQATEANAGDPQAVRARLSGAVDSIDMAIRDLRNYIFGLRPGILADRQLNQALHLLVEEFQEKSGVVTVVQIDERIAAQLGNTAAQLVQVTREALSNVARHAQATTCRVSLVQRDGGAVLEIGDDGRGFKPGRGTSRGQGLRNMRERVEAIGGTFSVESASGEGTTVRVILPL